ncbi:MAG: hypothetical protein J6X66_06000, partial [Lachnospiraceae bacterium]|nr:hypothetical protein [Lachnospiraceae bacterium]
MRKKIRTIIIFIAIWLLGFLVFCVWQYFRISKPHEYTVNNDAVFLSDAWFITDNDAQAGGIILRIAANGTVEAVYTTSDDPFIKGFFAEYIDNVTEENPAAIFSREVDDNGMMINQYCVVEFNEALQPVNISPIFRLPQEMTLSGFSADEDMFYATALSKSRQQTYVYTVPASVMLDAKEKGNDAVSKWKEERSEVNEFTLQECVLPRYFVDAEYAAGELNVRFDNSLPGYFALNRDAREVYENKKMTASAKIKAAGVQTPVLVLAAVIGCLLILLMFVIFNERRRVVYVIAALEVFMLVICAGSVLVLDHENRLNARDEHIRYTQL